MDQLNIILSDITLLLSGIILGSAITAFYISNILNNVYISPKTKNTKASAIKLHDTGTGERVVYINPGDLRNNIGLLYGLFFIKRNSERYVYLRNDKRDNKVFFTVIIVSVILIMYASYQIVYIQA